MVNVIELENDSGTIKALVSGITGLEDNLIVTVLCEYDPGQSYKAPTRHDEIGQEGLDDGVDISDCHIEYGTINGVKGQRSPDMGLDYDQLAEISDAIMSYKKGEEHSENHSCR